MLSEPVRITVADADLSRSRLTTLFRLFLAIPHMIVLAVMWVCGFVLAPFLWIATLFAGSPPPALAGYFHALIRYSLHVDAYLFLAAGPYPPFLGGAGSYVVDVTFPPLPRQSRWSIGFRSSPRQ